MMDALKLVAILGALLWLIPIIWPTGRDVATDPMPMSAALYYVFGVWLLLIGLAAVLTSMLSGAPPPKDEVDTTAEPDP